MAIKIRYPNLWERILIKENGKNEHHIYKVDARQRGWTARGYHRLGRLHIRQRSFFWPKERSLSDVQPAKPMVAASSPTALARINFVNVVFIFPILLD